MKCAACDVRQAVGLLDGEPVCGLCAAMVSFAEAKAPRRPVRVPDVPVMRDLHERLADLLRIEAAHSRVMAELARRRDEAAFYATARRGAELGGCLQ